MSRSCGRPAASGRDLQVLPPAALVPMSIYFLGFGERFFPVRHLVRGDLADLCRRDPRLAGYGSASPVDGAHVRLFEAPGVIAIRLPAAMPEIFTGLRLTAGLALIATVAAEMLASRNGLGFLLFDTAFSLHVDQTFAVLLVVALNGLLVNGMVGAAVG